ncbi:MAG: universal stress protein [Acidobacteriota bacterium]
MSDFSRILVTTDFSDQALPGVRTAAGLARSLGSSVELLYVVEDHLPPILGFTTESERDEILAGHARKAGERLATYAREHFDGCRVTTKAVVGTPPHAIVHAAMDGAADLIVIASRGFGPMRQLLIGSTAERVLHHAPCPVLVVPSKSREPAASVSDDHAEAWKSNIC